MNPLPRTTSARSGLFSSRRSTKRLTAAAVAAYPKPALPPRRPTTSGSFPSAVATATNTTTTSARPPPPPAALSSAVSLRARNPAFRDSRAQHRHLSRLQSFSSTSSESVTSRHRICSLIPSTRSIRVQAPSSSPASKLSFSTTASMASATKFYDFKPLDKKGNPYPFDTLHNKVVLIVNTASKCGFTPQFEGLEKLYKSITSEHPSGKDFIILGFPCNQFGNQDPGSNDDIQSFCQLNYGVTFPVLGKVDVNGDKADPVWEWLKAERPGIMGLKRIKWNFEKFLVGRDGEVKERWASTAKPESLKQAVEKELATGGAEK